MMRLRTLACAAVLALGGGAAEAQTTLTFAGSDAVGTLYDIQNKQFTEIVNRKAAGKVKINFIEGEQLGSDVQVIEQMMAGSVHLYGDALNWYGNWVNDVSILNWGFAFRDYDHLTKFLDSKTFEAIAETLRTKQGVRLLATGPMEPRIVFSKKPITGLKDLENIKMRVPEMKAFVTLWETLGTRPSRVVWGEVFLALKTGVVDAAEGPICSAYAIKFHQAAPNVTLTNHLLATTHIAINDRTFSALPADVQQIMIEAAREATQKTVKDSIAAAEDCVNKMRTEGAAVTTIDTKPIIDKARAAVQVVEQQGMWRVGLWQEVQGY